jgi:hypothetical protein
LCEAVQRLKAATPQGVLLGSAMLAGALDGLGLIDEYRFLIHPRIAGHGPKLHEGALRATRALELIAANPLGNGCVAVHYRRQPASNRLRSRRMAGDARASCTSLHHAEGVRSVEPWALARFFTLERLTELAGWPPEPADYALWAGRFAEPPFEQAEAARRRAGHPPAFGAAGRRANSAR